MIGATARALRTLAREAPALAAFDRRGAVRVLWADLARGALLRMVRRDASG